MSCCKKSHLTSLTPLHLPCIHAGKIHPQTAALGTARTSLLLLASHPSPSVLLCTGVLHGAEQASSPSRLCPCTASAAAPACLGLPCCPWAITWSLLLWPVSPPYSQATCPQWFRVLYLLGYIVLLSVLPETAWSALCLSAVVIPSINHSTTTFTAINLLPVFQIKTHFSLPYVNTSNKHRLNVFHF